MERHLYATCARLKITLLSVGHRDSLREFHQLELHIGDAGSWQMRAIDYTSTTASSSGSAASDRTSLDTQYTQL